MVVLNVLLPSTGYKENPFTANSLLDNGTVPKKQGPQPGVSIRPTHQGSAMQV